MFDIGWTELLVIGVVALIVIGPKDLPDMFRTLGRFSAKARSMARDFQRAMEAAADDAGVKDVAKDLKNIASPHSLGLNAVKDAATKFEKWDPLKTPRPAAVARAAAPPAATAVPAQASVLGGPLGPATQALADARAMKRAAVVAVGPPVIESPRLPDPVPDAAAPPVSGVAAATPDVRVKTSVRKSKAAPSASPGNSPADGAGKPARKARSRKSEE